MVSFFIKTGDPEVSQIFTPYLWGTASFGEIIDSKVNSVDYGEELDLILIKVYVEGKFEIYGPKHLTVENYSKTKKETGAAFTISRKDFHNKSDKERRLFLTSMVRIAISSIQLKHEKKICNYNFTLLKENFERAIDAYLNK